MVRRWSRVNYFNKPATDCYTTAIDVYLDESIRATLFTRQPYSEITVFRRRSTARRKHLHQWLMLTPVLADWANEYVQLKQYCKYSFGLNLFRNNYLTLNVFKQKALLFLAKDFYQTSFSVTIVRKWLNYFTKYHNPTYEYLMTLKHSSFLFTSSSTHYAESVKKPTSFTQPYYLATNRELTANSENVLDSRELFGGFDDLLFALHLSWSQELYKVLVLLSYFQLAYR